MLISTWNARKFIFRPEVLTNASIALKYSLIPNYLRQTVGPFLTKSLKEKSQHFPKTWRLIASKLCSHQCVSRMSVSVSHDRCSVVVGGEWSPNWQFWAVILDIENEEQGKGRAEWLMRKFHAMALNCMPSGCLEPALMVNMITARRQEVNFTFQKLAWCRQCRLLKRARQEHIMLYLCLLIWDYYPLCYSSILINKHSHSMIVEKSWIFTR